MSELNPEIWNNPTLGAAANNERLDRIEKQYLEDRNAKLEDREPREVKVDNDYPGWEPEKWNSHSTVVHFSDEQGNDVEKPFDPTVEPEEARENPGSPFEQGSEVEQDSETSEEPTFVVSTSEESDQL